MDSRTLDAQEVEFTGAASPLPESSDEPVDRFKQPASVVVSVPQRSFGSQRELETSSWESGDLALQDKSLESDWQGLSPWSESVAKRVFDCTCVLLATPLLVPLMLLVGALVRVTSRGPVFFLQDRMGRHSQTFKIIKFRTMEHLQDAKHHPVTTTDNQRFTPVGPFLRRWKLDELPQVLNILLGHMSLVGPRPKLPEHHIADLSCRPGITGMATIVFASEELFLARIPKEHLQAYYHSFVLPMKQQLDAEYMARATFFSDLRIIVNSTLRRWGNSSFDHFVWTSRASIRGDQNSARMSNPNDLTQPTSVKHWVGIMGFPGFFADGSATSNRPQ